MAGDEGLSWQAQLEKVRSQVTELEQRRETEKRLQQERNEKALSKRLKDDTPEALNQRFNEIRRRSDRAARMFYPLPHVEEVLLEINEFSNLLKFYSDCLKSFPKVFTPSHSTTFAALLRELESLQGGLERQIQQWREVHEIMQKTAFRARKHADDAALVDVAKTFSNRAHSVPLSIPGDYYAHEGENFFVADWEGTVLGHVKYWPAEKVVTFSLQPPDKVNFNKFVRGILYAFCAKGPLAEPMDAVRVRVSFVREVKFFTDIGFVRAETKGPSDWIYQRDLN